jgi:hypothetical protein
MTASILNKLGLKGHYPHAVAFAPQKVFGCGLLDLQVEQGLTHIQSLLDYCCTDHKVGRVMLISLRHLEVEAGVSFNLLQQPHTKLSYLTKCWMVSLRQFCADFDISIRRKQNRLPNIARTHDSCLMDNTLQLPFTKQKLLDVNLVRIYLQVTTLSDIVSADGQVILTLSWNGLQIPDRSSTMQFARQLQPTVYQRGLWRRLLRSYLVPGSKASALQLQQPLGVWITEPNMKWGAITWEETLYRRETAANAVWLSITLAI